LVKLLSAHNSDNRFLIFQKSKEIKEKYVGRKVYLRGLIEYSNICAKNCLYCGIRSHNKMVNRYTMSDTEVINAALYAYKNNYASIVIQSGEIQTPDFTVRITSLLNKIKELTEGSLRVTLSCGEQTYETYKEWYNAGAHRYLLRIETTNPQLYSALHPNDKNHLYKNRINTLKNLKKIGYQTGSGVMVGLPGQTLEDLANDLLFLKEFDIDMAGLGPYVEHLETPLYKDRMKLLSQNERYNLSLLMFSLLRIIMKDINIASTTALDALNPNGRIEALEIASNVIMPNLTPLKFTENYHLYNNKPDSLHVDQLVHKLKTAEKLKTNIIAFGEYGDSSHYKLRTF